MQHSELILTLTGGLTAALVLGYVTQRLGLSPIVGYLLAGIVVGPNTPGFVANRELANELAEIGVILLMFGVGLHFHLHELLAVRKIAIPGAVFQSLVATILGTLTIWAFGWGWEAGIVYGLAISVASTVVLTRVLVDNNDLHTPTGHIAIGWLVVEDLFTVVVLVLLPALFGKKEGPGDSPLWLLFLALLKIAALIALTFVIGGRVIPWMLTKIAQTGSRELFTLTILVVALGIAVGSTVGFGVSPALGAFLAGMVVGQSDFSLRAASDALPMRDAFAVLFFVSVGMLFDPEFLVESPGLIAATTAIVMLGKPIAAMGIVLVLGYPLKVAIAVSVALAQIGEFSFILAVLGKSLGVLPDAITNALIAASIFSISLNPVLYRMVDRFESWITQRPGVLKWITHRARQSARVTNASLEQDLVSSSRYRAVIIGYGPIGQTLRRLLHENEIESTIVEMNLDTIRRLKSENIPAIYGDASHIDTLKAAGVDRSATLILSASSIRNPEEIIRLAKELNPNIRIIARATYLRERTGFRKAGADRVFTGEGEVALAMTESILSGLGATPEQIDRERERLRTDLFGGTPESKAVEVVPSTKGEENLDEPKKAQAP